MADRKDQADGAASIALTSRQKKRMRRKQHLKNIKDKDPKHGRNAEMCDIKDMEEKADYYFENGLRKVYPYYFTFTTAVKERWEGRQILNVFAEEFQSNTEENYRKAIELGLLKVNGNPVSVDYKIKPLDVVISKIHRHENPVRDERIEVIYEDKDVLVVDKPPSIPCQPCGRHRFNSVVFILCKELGHPTLRNIYRLDWQTSGVMICAKNRDKATILEHQIQSGFVTKEYVCRVEGEFSLGVVTLDKPIDCVSHRLFLWRVAENGKPTKTVFERLSYNGTSSVVKCIPQEVRTAHHIRVHLQYLGHPILNDPIYNSEVWGPSKGKAGVYQRADEEVIKDVVRIHSVGEWTDEDNPILERKRQSEKLKQSSMLAPRPAHCTCPCTCTSQTVCEPSSTALGQPLTHPPSSHDTTPPSHHDNSSQSHALLNDTTSSGIENSSSVHRTELASDSSMSASVPGLEGNSSTDIAVEDDPFCEPQTKHPRTERQPNGQPSVMVDRLTTSDSGSSYLVNKEGSERCGFDLDHWNPDPYCAECKKNYIDPHPDDLMIYLHALRYKGPGWEYSTKLPDWARDDWQGE